MELETMDRLCLMQNLINETSHEGIVYEDEYVIVKRENGQITMTGNLFKNPFIYPEDLKGRNT